GGRLVSPGEYTVGGDFSGAAAFICMGAFADEKITVSGLDTRSLSGDGAIINILRDMDAKIEISAGEVICYPSKLHGTVIDVRDCPDLAPILAATALGAEGKTKIIGAKRLKFKETDRLSSVAATLLTLGGKITVSDDGFEIEKSEITGGEVDCGADHRLAMCAAVAAVIGRKKTEIRGAESVAKSYPDFWLDFGRISK
ncbi:MAG: 3-phosphoshikimate 1-carboxyvinyltransferase, partial [Clostridiales bacterium]|nr:3-phosphoshikimate 1-carboxyvinyltransferase [Clostridiales bacterium]